MMVGQAKRLGLKLALLSTVGFLGVSAAQAADQLDDIVVSASRIPLTANKVGSAVTVITADDIENRGGHYVSDILRDVPGLAVGRTGSFGALTTVRMRGTEGNHVLVVVDGIEINDQSAGSEVDFGHLQLSDIERIEVLRGSQSALWGSDAIGGVINITTKSGKGKPSGHALFELGSFGTTKTEASIRGGNETVWGALAVSQFKTDGVSQASEERGNLENDSHETQNLQVKLGVQPVENLTLELVGRVHSSELETDEFFGGTGATDGAGETDTNKRYGLVSAKYDAFDGQWTHQVRASYAEDKDKSRGGLFGPSTAEGKKTKFDYQTTVYFDTPDVANADHAVTFLVEEEKDRMDASFLGAGAVSTTNRAIALEYNVSLFDDLHLSASGRRDFNDRFEDENTYRLTAAYDVNAIDGRFHTSYGTGVKNPTLTELFGFSSNFVGNPNLEPEKNKSFDFGYEQSLFDDSVVVDVTYFRNRTDNLIVGSGTTAVNLDGTSPSEGVEFSAEVDVNDNLSLIGSYTYTNAETSDGTEQVRRPRHIASMNVNYSFLNDKANINVGLDYNGKTTDFAFDSFFNRSIVELDSYWLLNVQAHYDVNEHIRLYARGENVLNDEYEEVFTYGTPGIAAYGGVKVSF